MSPRPFRFGVVAAFARSADEWLAKARRAEQLGYSTLVMPDGLRYPLLAPWPALATAAAATRSLRVGTYVLDNDYRHPVLVAKDAASLDLLSGGRLELGIGAGRPTAAEDNQMLGQTFDSGAVRLARLAESIALLQPLLAGETASTRGKYYVVDNAVIAPAAVQKPRPPLLMAGLGRQLLGLAAREADIIALALPPDAPADVVAEKVGWIKQAAGDRFQQIELNLNLMAVADKVPHYVATQLGLTAAGLASHGAVSAVVGSVDQMCQTLLDRRERLGISYFVVGDELMEAFAPVVERLTGR